MFSAFVAWKGLGWLASFNGKVISLPQEATVIIEVKMNDYVRTLNCKNSKTTLIIIGFFAEWSVEPFRFQE